MPKAFRYALRQWRRYNSDAYCRRRDKTWPGYVKTMTKKAKEANPEDGIVAPHSGEQPRELRDFGPKPRDYIMGAKGKS